MRTREIAVEKWASFFESFSRRHRRKPADVSTVAPGLGVHYNARELPLTGVTAELAGADGRRIEIMLGGPLDRHLVHIIASPVRVRAAEWNDGYSAAIQIESDGGTKTLLRVGPEAEVLEPGVVLDDVELDGE